METQILQPEQTIIEEIQETKMINLQEYPLKENEVIIVSDEGRPFMVNTKRNDSKQFVISKDMKIVIPDEWKNDFPKSYIKLPSHLSKNMKRDHPYFCNEKYIVINQEELFASEGKNFIITYKSRMSYREIVPIKRYYINLFEAVRKAVEQFKAIVGSVYNEDHYDLLFYPDHRLSLYFMIIIRHDDVTITNSIEQSRRIGTIFTYLSGIKEHGGKIILYPTMRGTRLTYSFSDIISDYTHSHLPSDSARNFSSFCLGHSNDIFSGINGNLTTYNGATHFSASEIELEGIMLAIQDYIKWESLEGGPHRKMETVTLFGSKLGKDIYDKTRLKNEDYLKTEDKKQLVDFVITPKSLEELKSQFILVKKGKYHRFTYNPVLLTEKLIRIINENPAARKRFSNYVYDPITGSIAQLDNVGKEKFYTIVKDKESRLIPSYMNGEILCPTITMEKQEEEALLKMLFTVHPTEYIKIANAIVRLLNKEIQKNEYKGK